MILDKMGSLTMAATASPAAPRRLSGHGFRLTVNAANILASIPMTLGVIYFFWFSDPAKLFGILTPDRWGANMTWIAITYHFIRIPTATLTVFSKHHWLAPTLDIVSSVLQSSLWQLLSANGTPQ
jgi:hypothetical protein